MALTTWVIQEGVIGAADEALICAAVQAAGCAVERLKVTPFVHTAVPPFPDVAERCFVYGSSGLLHAARSLGWAPAGWDGDSFGARAVVDTFGNEALNEKAVLCEPAELPGVFTQQDWERIFLRPEAETKLFAGGVIDAGDVDVWVQNAAISPYANETIIAAPVQEIFAEWRCFCVDGQLIDICQYAVRGVRALKPGAPLSVKAFAEQAIQRNQPAPAFVMDIAETPAGFRVVEYNSINSAGFYACEVARVIAAVTAL